MSKGTMTTVFSSIIYTMFFAKSTTPVYVCYNSHKLKRGVEMTTLDLQQILLHSENEHIEFKSAREQYDEKKLMKYCVALSM